MKNYCMARVASGLFLFTALAAADLASAQEAAPSGARAPPRSAAASPARPRPVRQRAARRAESPRPSDATPGNTTPGNVATGNVAPPAASRQGDGQGFPGATSSQGITTSQGLNAKPATTMVPLMAGTLDLKNGVTVQLNYLSESAGNPTGGIRRGVAYADQFLLGVDADLNRLLGIKGGTIHFVGTQRDGNSLSQRYIGNSLAPQEIFDGSENTRLTILSYQQKLFNDRLDIEVGRLPAQGAFLVSPLYCNFQNVGVCGSPEIVFSDTSFTFFPTSTWGGHAKYFLNDKVFFHAGAFEVKPSTVGQNDHGLNFSLHGSTGVFVPLELGYTTTAANDPYPRNYGIGAIVDRSTYSDPVTDVSGGRSLFSGLAPRTRFGRSLVYGRFDQTVWRPDPASTRALQVFGVAAVGVGGRQTQDFQLEAGAVLTGPFASRPYDTVGVVGTYQKYSPLGLANVRAARASQGLSSANVATDQILFEVNYGFQVTPAVRLTPNLQYIVNPDQNGIPFRRRPIPDTFVIGAKLSIDFFTLANLAKGPGSL